MCVSVYVCMCVCVCMRKCVGYVYVGILCVSKYMDVCDMYMWVYCVYVSVCMCECI